MSELRLDCSELTAEVVLNTPEEDFVLDAAEVSAEIVLDGRWVDRPIWTLIKGTVAGHSQVVGYESVTRELSGRIDGHSSVSGRGGFRLAARGEIAAHSGLAGDATVFRLVALQGRVYARGGVGTRSVLLHKQADAMYPYVIKSKEFMPTTWPQIGSLRLGKNTYTYYQWQNISGGGPTYDGCEFRGLAKRNGNIFWPFDNQTFLDGEAMGYAVTSFPYDLEQVCGYYPAGATILHPQTGYIPWMVKGPARGYLRILRSDLSPDEEFQDVRRIYPGGTFGKGYFILPGPLSRSILSSATLQFYTPRDH
jgi:hypothetical protein